MDEFQIILTKLLHGKRLRQPFIYDPATSSFRDDLKARLDNFMERINKFRPSNGDLEDYIHSHREEFQTICNLLTMSLDEYLTGSAGKAYDRIEELFNTPLFRNNITHLIKNMSRYSPSVDIAPPLFRVRLSDQDIGTRESMFHIPFNQRELVRNQRYSIAGLPCLYLGTSLYVCWQEMGKPDLNKLYLSRYKMSSFESARSVKFLNFAYSLETLKHNNDLEALFENDIHSLNVQKAYLVFFPLLLACSYNRAHTNASFHAEYIVPNLLLQWINKEKSQVKGISYFSTKTKQLRHHDIGINFVFPPDTVAPQNKGYCPFLKENFKLSKAISWQLLDAIKENKFAHNFPPQFTDDIEEDFIKNYKHTKFHEAEHKLSNLMPLGQIE